MTKPGKRGGGVRSDVDDATQDASDAGPALDRVIQAQIGDKLRAMYGELSEQPLPDRLTAILARLATGHRPDASS